MAGTSTVRINQSTHDILRQLAERNKESMQEVIAKAVEEYRRGRIFDEADSAYAALKSSATDWGEELKDRNLWEATLGDGLDGQ